MSPVTPPTSPVKTQWIDLLGNAAAGSFSGYLALPPAGEGPGLVLFQEIFGVNAHIRAVAEQYALDGFVVLAPDMFWRQTPRVDLGYVGADRDQAMGHMRDCQVDEVMTDISAAAQALKAMAAVKGGVGALGYCMGGRFAYLAAAQGVVSAAVSYYGGGIQNVLDLSSRVRCPMQFHYAGIDEAIPPTAVAAVQDAFAGKPAEFHLYEGAHHGFNCWARGAYHAPSAAKAHARTLGFLADALY
jgi:carboxymethylenebutenolidase